MARWRKKPVVIDAKEWTGDLDEMEAWLHEVGGNPGIILLNEDLRQVSIKTLEGEMIGDVGDFIIRGIRGEFYPCKPDIFKASYERVD